MHSELIQETESILKEFERTWTYDSRDLLRPGLETVLKDLISRRPNEIRSRLELEFFGEGPLRDLIQDPLVTEIIVNGQNEIWFEREGHLVRCEDRFLSPATFKNFIERVSHDSSLHVNLSQPFADGRWRHFRVHLACAPLVHCAFHLTLRRSNESPWTLDALLELGWASSERIASLRQLLARRDNLLFIGPTGSGKTSVLSACLKELPGHERIVIIEDTDELPRPNAASTKLLTRPASAQLREVNLTDLVRQSLRMRPQRLAVGEVRGAEAKDLLLALATGHNGSLGTLHASDPRQALLRLEMLVQLGAPQWQTQAIRQLIQLGVNGLVVCGLKDGRRYLEGLHRVVALESVGFLLEPL
jgi:pilus assembly protein CpaF